MIPFQERRAVRGMVAAVDHQAAGAGLAMLRQGGSAADAAIAASAALAVTSQHLCGMGGDLFALVHTGEAEVSALNASGRAGAGASAAALRAEGHDRMPFRGDIRTVTVPGCVDGWTTLHERYGRLSFAEVLAPAIELADAGFAPSPTQRLARALMAQCPGGGDYAGDGDVIRRTRLAEELRTIAAGGREAFYGGRFGAGLLELGCGWFHESDLASSSAEWVAALSADAFGHRVWTTPPNSQGYLTLAAAAILERFGLPGDTESAPWAHALVEASRAAAHDRLDVLHDRADGAALLATDRLHPRAARLTGDAAADWGTERAGAGDTMCLTAVDRERMAVTLIQSNASGWGCGIVEPSTGIFLHNRGIGFSLAAGHPAELAPGRRPPHTLSPLMVTDPDGALRMAIGTMGGDSQPQILLQLLARVLVHGATPAEAIGAPRFVLGPLGGGGGFETWEDNGQVAVRVERNAPSAWAPGLAARGHAVEIVDEFNHGMGHAHAIAVDGRVLTGAADPRSRSGDAAGY